MGKIRIDKISTPDNNPSEGYIYIYVDENDGLVKQKDENGNILTITNQSDFTPELLEKLNGIEVNANNYNITSDLVNNLEDGGENKALSAEQGKLIKEAIDNINEILESDDTDLDTLKEIVDYIQNNKDDLDNLAIDNIAGLQDALDNKSDIGHTHQYTEITNFQDGVNINDNVSENTRLRHTHDNKQVLDNIIDSGTGEKFLSDDGIYKYTNICGEANYILLTSNSDELSPSSDKGRLYYDGTHIKLSNTNNSVIIGKMVPFVSGVSREYLKVNTTTTISIIGGNFDTSTIVKINSNVATLDGFNVVSNDEIEITITTYGNEGNAEIIVSNGIDDHFGNTVNIEVKHKKELDEIVTSFISNSANIAALIEDQYNFSGGDSGNYISDGGGDMYDGGNKLYTSLGGAYNYSNGLIRSTTGIKYVTKKSNYIFMGAFDFLDDISRFKIDGNNGADGGGSKHSGILHIGGYIVYYKTVGGTGDPSINHIHILENNSYTSQVIGRSTDSDLDKIINLDQGNIDRLCYFLYAKKSGAQSSVDEITSIANYLITNVI